MKTPKSRAQNTPVVLPLSVMFLAAVLSIYGAFGMLANDYRIQDPKLAWFVTVSGLALFGMGWAGIRNCWLFGLLLLSLFVGGAAQLWMTEPLWFPALRFNPDQDFDLLMIALIALQGALAAVTLFMTGALPKLGTFFQTFGTVRILLFLALSAVFSVSPLGFLSYGGITSYASHLVAGGVMIALNLATVAAMLRVKSPGSGDTTFHPLVPACLSFLVAATLAWFAFERIPHVEDEVAFLFQARSLAAGVLAVPAPPEAAVVGLEHYLLEVRDGYWFSTTPPGWPAFLSLGILIGAPWLINPALAFVAVLLAHNIARRTTDDTTARILVILMAASPWFLGTSASLMPHSLALTLTLFAWWALLHSFDKGAKVALWAGLAGLAMGWLFATRQLEALILGTLTGLWILSKVKEEGGLARLLPYGIGCILAGGCYLWFNFAMTGDPLLDPLKRYLNESWGTGSNGYGFGPGIGPPGGWGALDLSPGHSIFEGTVNLINNMTALSIEFLGWGVGSLALLWIYLFYAKPSRFELAMMLICVLVVGALFLYWFSGSFYIGPRYWFSTFFPLLIFSAKGLQILQEKMRDMGIGREASGTVFLVLCLFGLGVFTSWRGVEKYHEYGNFHSTPRDMKEAEDLRGSLVFFNPETIDYGSAFATNDPWLREEHPLFIRDMGAEINTQVINAYPGRKVVYIGNEE